MTSALNAANMCLADKFYSVIISGLYYISCISCSVYILSVAVYFVYLLFKRAVWLKKSF